MARIEDISWGSYQEFEGPFYRGKAKFELPKNPSVQDKRLYLITCIESGHYDAINMYDRMIVSAGLIQWGEANTFSVTKLLGTICDSGNESMVLSYLKPALLASGATFKKNQKGIWRFYITDIEVNSISAQQKLFLGCDGRKGSWKTEELKSYAKLWASCIASVLEDPRTREVQKKFTMDRMMGFVTPEAKKVLFEDKNPSDWAEATRAIYLTFAINLPRIAGEMFSSTRFVGDKWSPEWCLSLIKKLTFGPNVKIYPKRYDALRPIAERIFGIDMPQTAGDLDKWDPRKDPIPSNPMVVETKNSINEELLNELNQIVSNKPVIVQQQNKGFLETFKRIFNKILLFLFNK